MQARGIEKGLVLFYSQVHTGDGTEGAPSETVGILIFRHVRSSSPPNYKARAMRQVSTKAEGRGLPAAARRHHLPIKPCSELAQNVGWTKGQLSNSSILNPGQARGNPNVHWKTIISQASLGQLLLLPKKMTVIGFILSMSLG